ncbi:MAG: Pr6Pr family membrane protein [Arachnia sp.]
MRHEWQRIWHGLTLAVVVATLVLQLTLTVLGPTFGETLAVRLLHQVSYFTIQSNILVAISVAPLVRDPQRQGAFWSALRAAGLLGITVTALIHYFVLRPIIDVDGWFAVSGDSLHVVVPIMTLLGWLVFGPRPRLPWRALFSSLVWPIAWLGYTLIMGAVTGWYPYPFVNAAELGYASVLITSVVITAIFLGLAALLRLVDAKLPAPQSIRVLSATDVEDHA